MKITNIELDKPINDYIIDKKIKYYEQYRQSPTVLIISYPLFNWLKTACLDNLKYGVGSFKESILLETKFGLGNFEGLEIVKTYKDNIIEVY